MEKAYIQMLEEFYQNGRGVLDKVDAGGFLTPVQLYCHHVDTPEGRQVLVGLKVGEGHLS